MKRLKKKKRALAEEDGIEISRMFLNGVFQVLKKLLSHGILNQTVQLAIDQFVPLLNRLSDNSPTPGSVELVYDHGLILLNGRKMESHHSTTESSKGVTEYFELSMIESIQLHKSIEREDLEDFLKDWSKHCQQNRRPKKFECVIKGVEIKNFDPERAHLLFKTPQTLGSSQHALRQYFLLRNYLSEFYQGVIDNKLISQRKLRRQLVELADIAKVDPFNVLSLGLIHNEGNEKSSPCPLTQASATGTLVMLLAKEFNFAKRDQINLGVIGLIYNVGLLSKEGEIALKEGELSPEEYKRVLHAQQGGLLKLMKLEGTSRPVLDRLASIFGYLHSVEDHTVADALDSLILACCSQYVALTSKRPYRDAYLPSEAIRILGNEVKKHGTKGLEAIVYYVFVRMMGVYPIGSLCELSDGQRAVIYRPHGKEQGLPVVKLVDREKELILDLADEADLEIIKTLDPIEEGINVSGYFFEPIL